MMHFVKLHQLYDAENKKLLDPIFVNLDHVHSIKKTNNKTWLGFAEGDIGVVESPEEVLRAEVQYGYVMHTVL